MLGTRAAAEMCQCHNPMMPSNLALLLLENVCVRKVWNLHLYLTNRDRRGVKIEISILDHSDDARAGGLSSTVLEELRRYADR